MSRLSVAVLILSGVVVSLTATAVRADCQEDITAIMKRRQAAVELVNKSAKAAGGKIDPIAACPKLRTLASIEGEANSYFQKNKDWCSLPGEFVDRMSTSFSRTSGFAQKACSIAVQVKKMQAQQQAQQAQQAKDAAPKLPTGPL